MKIGIFTFLFLLIAVQQASAVVISEVFYDSIGNDTVNGTSQEFVELYNPTSTAVNLANWRLEEGNGANGKWSLEVPLNGSIPAYGFFLIGYGKNVNADLRWNVSLQNGPDAVRIVNPNNVSEDMLGYGALSNSSLFEGSPSPDVSEGHSLERRPGYLDPLAGNGQDTQNNSNDFLERTTPEPQNSSSVEKATPSVLRSLAGNGAYGPNMSVGVTLSYTHFDAQVGLIIREYNLFGVINASPPADVNDPGLAKWLLNGNGISDGVITYSFLTPTQPGTYTISGDWSATDANSSLTNGSISDTLFTVSGGLQGWVEDIFGIRLQGATVTGGGANTTTDNNGFYAYSPQGGLQNISALQTEYLISNAVINTSSTFTLNFTGSLALTPLTLNDTSMLGAVVRWANGHVNDGKLLEVVHQWAHS